MTDINKALLAVLVILILTSAALMAVLTYTLTRIPRTGGIRLACVGDSITEGTQYPADLQALLGPRYLVGNFGAGGTTVVQKTEKPYINQTSFEKAKQSLPNIVVIMLGTNDAAPVAYRYIDDFVIDYKMLIENFSSLSTHPKIWLVKPPPIYDNSLGPDQSNLVEGVIPRIEQVAENLSLPVIDVYSALTAHPQYFWDGVHPNSQGSKLIAQQIYNSITSK